MQIKIPNEVSVRFTGKGISYILDILASQPFKDVNGLINDILGQLKAEGERDGPKLDRSNEDPTGRGDSGSGDRGLPSVEG